MTKEKAIERYVSFCLRKQRLCYSNSHYWLGEGTDTDSEIEVYYPSYIDETPSFYFYYFDNGYLREIGKMSGTHYKTIEVIIKKYLIKRIRNHYNYRKRNNK